MTASIVILATKKHKNYTCFVPFSGYSVPFGG